MLLLYPHSYTTMIMIKTSNYTMNRIKYDSHMYINAQIFYINKACLQFDAFRITAILIENAIKSKYNWKSAYHPRVFYTRAKNIWTGTFIYPINVQPSFPARMYQSENSLRRNIFKNHAGYGKRSIGPKQKKKNNIIYHLEHFANISISKFRFRYNLRSFESLPSLPVTI